MDFFTNSSTEDLKAVISQSSLNFAPSFSAFSFEVLTKSTNPSSAILRISGMSLRKAAWSSADISFKVLVLMRR